MLTVAPATLVALLRSRLRARLLLFARSSFSRDSLSILHGRICQRQDLEYLIWVKARGRAKQLLFLKPTHSTLIMVCTTRPRARASETPSARSAVNASDCTS